MATIADLNEKITLLQDAINAEQAQIATVIQGLKDANAALQDIINAGGVIQPGQLDALANKIDIAIADLESTVPDNGDHPLPE